MATGPTAQPGEGEPEPSQPRAEVPEQPTESGARRLVVAIVLLGVGLGASVLGVRMVGAVNRVGFRQRDQAAARSVPRSVKIAAAPHSAVYVVWAPSRSQVKMPAGTGA
jgi:hypothetical protein